MKPSTVLQFLSGSVAVYVIMAACGGSVGRSSLVADGGTGSGAGSSGGGSAAGSGGDGASVLDALTDPVGRAMADPYQSGTRLKTKYIGGSDGSKQFTGWHDALLDLDCAFVTAADGNLHCMPLVGSPISFFADGKCTRPLASAINGDICNQPSGYANYTDTGMAGCTSTYTQHFYPIGALTTPGQFVYENLGSQGCTPVSTVPTFASYIFYSTGPELDPSNYVQATVQTEP